MSFGLTSAIFMNSAILVTRVRNFL